ncbi:hypothetical protein C2S51_035698 [Perilla frutescens var. frutescens]|nr:hypothetical protein C2S51_035698 [Perilla frutescens var. frutescens]
MEKKNSVLKKLERYLSLRRRGRSTAAARVAPTGCFTVYVGAEKQRFVIKTEYANHPLFKMLLEDAELEYGFSSEGPLLLPCHVDLFCKILAEMEMDATPDIDDHRHAAATCSPFNPSRRRLGKTTDHMARGCASYDLLTPPRLLRINP